MTPDKWLGQEFGGEYFSGNFDHLKYTLNQLNLTLFPKIITVVGTNGKGETSRLINQVLVDEGKSVGLWTSPHLFKVNERFCFFGEFLSDEVLLTSFAEVKESLKEFQFKYSYFEFLFVCFLHLARKFQLEYLVLEVGLGGRLDAVNCLDAQFVALPSISRDHQKILGKRYSQILAEKLGVLRKGQIFFSCLELSYLRRLTGIEVKKLALNWRDLFEEKICDDQDSFSLRNVALATAMVKEILKKEISLQSNFARRYFLKVKNCEIDFYSSHNPDGVRKLVQLLSQAKYNNYQLIIVSLSDRSVEDCRVMLGLLKSLFNEASFIYYHFVHGKSLSEQKLELIKEDFEFDIIECDKIFKEIDFNKKQKILCTGSQYFFSDIVSRLQSGR